MRILIVAEVYLPKVDGVVIRTMNLIKRLQEQGDEVLVVCPATDEGRESPVPVAEFRSFPFPAYPEYRIGIPDERLIGVIREFAPDVLHYLNPFAFGFRCHDVVRKANLDIPGVFSFHTLYGEYVKQYPFLGSLSPLLWWLTRSYHNRADVNLTVSSVMKDELAGRGFDRVELWPPAVDSSLFKPEQGSAEMRNRLSAGHPEAPLLITVSRLAPEKNVAFLAGVMRQVPQARLAVVGDGPQRQELERTFQGTNTTFVGYLKGQELATAYASSDAFVYASETETMGNVILEAMASGLGVVAPRAGGIPSLVNEGESGLLFEPGDLPAATAQITSLLNDERLRDQMGGAAREHVAHWSWENGADIVRSYYREAIDSHRRLTDQMAATSRLAPLAISGMVSFFRALAWSQRRGTATNQEIAIESSNSVSPVGMAALQPPGNSYGNSL